MDRSQVAATAAAGAALVAMWAVSAGYVPEPAADRPVWYLLGALIAGYWLAFVGWARSGRGRGQEQYRDRNRGPDRARTGDEGGTGGRGRERD